MSKLTRRQLIRHSLTGLAAAGVTALTLRADAGPTDATEDRLGGLSRALEAAGVAADPDEELFRDRHLSVVRRRGG